MIAELLALTMTWTTPVMRWTGPPSAILTPATFDLATRSVSDWPEQALANLSLKPAQARQMITALVLGERAALPKMPRCVLLNNPLCIKGVGWNGQLGHDDEGHAAFASLALGARAGAALLRRYYVDFGRHSAFAIVSHWAPAQCFPGIGGQVSKAIAPFGIGRTLRARWLASHRRRIFRSVRIATTAPIAVPSLMPMPPINAPSAAPPRPKAASSFCVGGVLRFENYAFAAAAGVAKDTRADLGLFAADGAPTLALTRIIENMAAIEIGPQRLAPGFVQKMQPPSAAPPQGR